MDVTLPNGVVIRGVPEAATKDQIMQKAIASGLATEADFKSQQPEAKDPEVEPVPQGDEEAEEGGMWARAKGVARNAGGNLVAQGETVATMLSGVAAEPVSGLIGLGAAAVPGGRTGGDMVDIVRDKLTYQPKTDKGAELIGQVADVLSPVGDVVSSVERSAGDFGYERAGPLAGALATAAPAAALELMGLGAAKRAIKAPAAAKRLSIDASDPGGQPVALDGPVVADAPPAPIAIEDAARSPSVQENAARQKAFDDLGLTPTEAQRTRDTDLFVEQQDAYRRGGRVRTALEAQEELLDRRATGEIEAIGGRPDAAATSPIEAITDKAIQLDEEISGLYKKARETIPADKNVKLSRAVQALKENAPSNELSGGVVKALRDKMVSMGVADKKFNAVGRIDVDSAEELRKYANRLYPSTNGEGRHIIGQFKERLDKDVFSAAGGDLFGEARKAKASFERGLDPAKNNKFDSRRTSLVRDIRDNLVTEDEFVDKVLKRSSKYKASDLAELKNYLQSGTDGQIAQGMQAWNDIRASALQRIKEKSFSGPVTQTGTQSLSRAKLDGALKEIGPQKLNVLFSEAEREFLKKLEAVSVLKEPPPGTFTGSGPSGPAIRKVENLLSKIPVFGEFTKDIVDGVKNKASERRVLTLVNDLEKINKENRKIEAGLFRRRAAYGSGAAAGIGLGLSGGNKEGADAAN